MELNDQCMGDVSILLKQKFPQMNGKKPITLPKDIKRCDKCTVYPLGDWAPLDCQCCEGQWAVIFDILLSTNWLIKENVSVLENIYGSFGQYIGQAVRCKEISYLQKLL